MVVIVITDFREAPPSFDLHSCVALQDSPVVPIGRSARTDVLLKAENIVLESGGCVVRLAGLYISFIKCESRDLLIFGETSGFMLLISNQSCKCIPTLHAPSLTLNTKKIEVHMFIGWRKVLSNFVQITSSILYTMRCVFVFVDLFIIPTL